MENKYRNVYCGEVTKEYENKEVRLAGWIETVSIHYIKRWNRYRTINF